MTFFEPWRNYVLKFGNNEGMCILPDDSGEFQNLSVLTCMTPEVIEFVEIKKNRRLLLSGRPGRLFDKILRVYQGSGFRIRGG